MIRKEIIIVLTLLNLNCKSSIDLDCRSGFEKNEGHIFIENTFSIIEKRLSNTLGVSGDIHLFNFFEKLSNIESSIIFGDVSYYEKTSDSKKDIRKWKEWYNHNGCDIKAETVDSIKMLVGIEPTR